MHIDLGAERGLTRSQENVRLKLLQAANPVFKKSTWENTSDVYEVYLVTMQGGKSRDHILAG